MFKKFGGYKQSIIFVYINYGNAMKIVKKSDRLTQVKDGNKIIFEVLMSKSGNKFNSFKNGLGICLDRPTLEDCIKDTFTKIGVMNQDFLTRLVSL